MIEIESWIKQLKEKMEKTFGKRILLLGLQGSYGRGEQTEQSDVDIVVIFDYLDGTTLRLYGTLLDTMPHREKICGFVSGKEELMAWDRGDLFQFYYDTSPVLGTLEQVMPRPQKEDAVCAARMGACTLYHTCVHNMLHEKNPEIVRSLYNLSADVPRL